jgi:hypothetical protein
MVKKVSLSWNDGRDDDKSREMIKDRRGEKWKWEIEIIKQREIRALYAKTGANPDGDARLPQKEPRLPDAATPKVRLYD